MPKDTYHGPLEQVDACCWRIPKSYKQGMRVDGLIFTNEQLLPQVMKDQAPEQVVNVAFLPGIQSASLAMPDIHWGYGFCIGGVAATDPNEGGVISPGGVGYDINCGVRLVASRLQAEDIRPRLRDIVAALFSAIPCGVGGGGALTRLDRRELDRVARTRARWCVDRGLDQLGTLGSGNHFLELDTVAEVYNPGLAQAFGLEPGALVFQVHCGSRGFGYQVCEDSLTMMERAVTKYRMELPDRQLA